MLFLWLALKKFSQQTFQAFQQVGNGCGHCTCYECRGFATRCGFLRLEGAAWRYHVLKDAMCDGCLHVWIRGRVFLRSLKVGFSGMASSHFATCTIIFASAPLVIVCSGRNVP